MAKIKDLDGRVENGERGRKRKRERKVVVEGEKQQDGTEVTGGNSERERENKEQAPWCG